MLVTSVANQNDQDGPSFPPCRHPSFKTKHCRPLLVPNLIQIAYCSDTRDSMAFPLLDIVLLVLFHVTLNADSKSPSCRHGIPQTHLTTPLPEHTSRCLRPVRDLAQTIHPLCAGRFCEAITLSGYRVHKTPRPITLLKGVSRVPTIHTINMHARLSLYVST